MTTAKRELRRLPVEGLELRADKEKRTITGYAVLFNSRSVDLGGFTEVIAPDAFSRSLADGKIDVVSTFNHDPNQMLGRVSAKTLTLAADERGIKFTAEVPNTSYGNDVLELVARGDVKGNSFEFRASKDAWTKLADGKRQRTVLDGELYQVGPVVSPAYTETDLALRAAPPADEPAPDFDKIKRQNANAKARLAVA